MDKQQGRIYLLLLFFLMMKEKMGRFRTVTELKVKYRRRTRTDFMSAFYS